MSKPIIFIFIIFLGLTFAFYYYFKLFLPLIIINSESLQISDFAYHVLIAKGFWFDGLPIYSLDSQLRVVQEAFGMPVTTAMPIGVLPIALVIWAPFAVMARWNLELATATWISFSLTFLGLVLYRILSLDGRGKKDIFFAVFILIIVMLSGVGLSGVVLGQTSIFVTALFLLLLFDMERASKRKTFSKEQSSTQTDWASICLQAIIVLSLSIKPTYMLIGLSILIVNRNYLAAVFAGLLNLLVCVLLTIKIGSGWVGEYLNALQIYSSGEMPKVYAGAVNPEIIVSFFSATFKSIGAKWASGVSKMILVLIYIFILLRSQFISADKIGNVIVKYNYLLIVLPLLFLPYVGAYEDLLYLAPAILYVRLSGRLSSLPNIFFLLTLFLFFNHPMFEPSKPLLFFFLVKFFLFGLTLRLIPVNTVRERFP